MNYFQRLLLIALFLSGPSLLYHSCATAGEGGSSHYNPGTLGDFAMALIGPAGWYVRNDLWYMDGEMGAVTRGNFTLQDVSQKAWINTIKTIYLTESGIWGGRFGNVLSVPIVLDVDVDGTLAGTGLEKSGSRSGISDLTYTLFLNWHKNEFNYSIGLNTYIPVGYYDVDSIINLGRNYWSFDPALTFTWLHPQRGHEISLITGVMFNTENPDTSYQTGTEFHLDWNIAQHFSKSFAVGFIGYYYKQISDDEGPLLDKLNGILVSSGGQSKDGFRGEALGLGAAATFTTEVASTNLSFIVKYLANIDNSNRLSNDYLTFSIALPL